MKLLKATPESEKQRRQPAQLVSNPFTRAEVEMESEALQPVAEPDPLILGERVVEPGPRAPLHANQSAAPRTTGPLQVWGLHGGAGASTLTILLAEAGCEVVDAGRWDPSTAIEGPCVVVATTRGAGLAAVKAFAHAWHTGQLPAATVLGVVLVDDAPQQPRAMKKAAPGASGVLPRLWRIPWSEDLRMATSPSPDLPLSWRTRLSIKSIHRTYTSL